MAALADYIDLRIAVAEMVDRRDISDVILRMTLSAEAKLNKMLRCREQLTTGATLTFTSGIAPLPSDFLSVETIWDATERFPLEGSVKQVLQSAQDAYAFSIVGTNVYLYGLTGTRLMDYYAALPTLTTTVTTSNWLLAKCPDLYLYAVSLEVAKWLKNVELAQATDELLKRELSDLQNADAYERYGSSSIRMRSPTP
jgi:hypothetical protein